MLPKDMLHGGIQKIAIEPYLRDDIYCGSSNCTVCDSSTARLSSSASTILVPDTNVVLNQIDLLENAAIDDVVVLSIVLNEVKKKNLSVHNRLRALTNNPLRRFFVFSNEHHKDTYIKAMAGESPSDRNDRAIRVTTEWYQRHLGGSKRVLLITNDKENKRKATEQGISAETVETYVKSLGQTDLLDLVHSNSEEVNNEDVEDLRPSKREVIYSEHKPMSEITSSLHRGNMNRSFDGDVDGDVVAVELLPKEQWQGSSLSTADDEDEEEEGVRLVPNSADDAPRTKDVSQDSAGNVGSAPSQPSGCVVDVIERNWQPVMEAEMQSQQEVTPANESELEKNVSALIKDKVMLEERCEEKSQENCELKKKLEAAVKQNGILKEKHDAQQKLVSELLAEKVNLLRLCDKQIQEQRDAMNQYDTVVSEKNSMRRELHQCRASVSNLTTDKVRLSQFCQEQEQKAHEIKLRYDVEVARTNELTNRLNRSEHQLTEKCEQYIKLDEVCTQTRAEVVQLKKTKDSQDSCVDFVIDNFIVVLHYVSLFLLALSHNSYIGNICSPLLAMLLWCHAFASFRKRKSLLRLLTLANASAHIFTTIVEMHNTLKATKNPKVKVPEGPEGVTIAAVWILCIGIIFGHLDTCTRRSRRALEKGKIGNWSFYYI